MRLLENHGASLRHYNLRRSHRRWNNDLGRLNNDWLLDHDGLLHDDWLLHDGRSRVDDPWRRRRRWLARQNRSSHEAEYPSPDHCRGSATMMMVVMTAVEVRRRRASVVVWPTGARAESAARRPCERSGGQRGRYCEYSQFVDLHGVLLIVVLG